MAGVADQDYGAAFVGIALDFVMDFGDQRAGRVDHAQIALAGAVPFAGRNSVSAEDHALAAGNFIKALDENRALGLKRFEHEAVVNYLMAHEERTREGAQRAADRLDRAIHAGAKAARFREDYFFDR